MNDSVRLGPPVRFVVMGVVCVLGLVYLPNSWWGIALKIFLAFWLLGTLKGAFSDSWHEYQTLGAFVTIQIVAISALVVFMNMPLVTFLAIAVALLGWIVMIKRIREANEGRLPY